MIASLIALAIATQPQDGLFVEEAARCGIKAHQIVWTKDAEGKVTARIEIKDGPDAVPFAAIQCLAKWSLKTGNRLGLVSEPTKPPTNPNGS